MTYKALSNCESAMVLEGERNRKVRISGWSRSLMSEEVIPSGVNKDDEPSWLGAWQKDIKFNVVHGISTRHGYILKAM